MVVVVFSTSLSYYTVLHMYLHVLLLPPIYYTPSMIYHRSAITITITITSIIISRNNRVLVLLIAVIHSSSGSSSSSSSSSSRSS